MTETPKVDETGHANKTRTRMGCPFLSIDQGVSTSLTPRMSVNHETTIMPFGLRNVKAIEEAIIDLREVKGHLATLQGGS
ncbi:hypothetical protein CRG98_039202 [Punica granatum]|uniref:Uncharacterized protein n=1 Tax=Punica granatum TaxID=22663 RepID=A0A2I0I8T6_PUNGR|nr:hypothetical protein CRG98_039202 [Punica granatum]